jgi:hypothetical protein
MCGPAGFFHLAQICDDNIHHSAELVTCLPDRRDADAFDSAM